MTQPADEPRAVTTAGSVVVDGIPVGSPEAGKSPDLGMRGMVAALVLLLVAAFASRLIFGLHTGLDGDESTTAFTALRITQGHLVLMESNLHYQAALESYIIAPFVWLLGPTGLAVRVPVALVGTLFVLALYDLGHTIFRRRTAGLVLACVGAVFPVFELVWSMKARSGYAETMVFAVVCLCLAARIGWQPRGDRLRNWILLGLVAGLGLWNYLLIAVPLAPVAVALLCRAPALGWRRTLRGAGAALGGLLVGFSPWLAYNATHHLASLQNLPSYVTSIPHAVKGLVEQELPIFAGTSSECGSNTVTPWVAWVGLAALTVAVLWLRRKPIERLLRGDLRSLEPVEMLLAIAPVAVVAVVAGRFNDVPCEPRYLLPLAIPLAVGATLVLMVRSRWRFLTAGLSIAYLVLAGFTAYGPTVDALPYTTTGAPIPLNRTQIVTELEGRHVTALFGDYWVARPILYLSGDRIDAAVYNGPIGFPSVQAAAVASPDPAWLFVDGDPDIGIFQALMRSRGVTSSEVSVGGYELFEGFSAPLHPSDLTAFAS
jgi:4-amino-4-deoxy-L-arabinose transferase-like glycosyltransferase